MQRAGDDVVAAVAGMVHDARLDQLAADRPEPQHAAR